MSLDFYDEKALELIGLEIQISKMKKPTLQKGFTVGKLIINRNVLKKMNICSKLQLESLQDALIEREYYLLEYNPVDSFILINTKILKGQSNLLEQENVEQLTKTAKNIAIEYFTEREKINKNNSGLA